MKKVSKYVVAWALVAIAASGVFYNPLSSTCNNKTVEVLAAMDDATELQDQYGYTNWPSLEAAQNYYGTDFTYSATAGHPYNYFYCFSNGSRMYFGIREEIR